MTEIDPFDFITDENFREKVRLIESVIETLKPEHQEIVRETFREDLSPEQYAVYQIVSDSIRAEYERTRAADR